MSLCPDNSTECLIRALLDASLEANNEYNWDPATFGFTVAIGFLAFLVAVITVFQGLFTAGPGRLRASPGAIGTFARYTHSRPSLREVRVKTRTKVPLLILPSIDAEGVLEDPDGWAQHQDPLEGTETTFDSTEDMQELIVPDLRADFHNQASKAAEDSKSRQGVNDAKVAKKPRLLQWSLPGKKKFDGLARKSTKLHSYAAGWARLLEEFEDPIETFVGGDSALHTRGMPKLMDCDVDYAPSDLTAAPATGSVETIVMLAVLAGCNFVGIDASSAYPIARGANMQLSFREHPQLGWTATFQKYPTDRIYHVLSDLPTLYRECDIRSPNHFQTVRRLLRMAKGLDLVPDEVVDPPLRYNLEDPYSAIDSVYVLMVAGMGWNKAVPFDKMDIHLAALTLSQASLAWRDLNPNKVKDALLELEGLGDLQIWWDVDTEIEKCLDFDRWPFRLPKKNKRQDIGGGVV